MKSCRRLTVEASIPLAAFFQLKVRKGPCDYLPAVSYLLVKDSIFVSDAVTVGGQAQRGHGVQETGCGDEGKQTSEVKGRVPGAAVPLPASLPRPPFPSPASSSISSSSSMSRPSCSRQDRVRR